MKNNKREKKRGKKNVGKGKEGERKKNPLNSANTLMVDEFGFK